MDSLQLFTCPDDDAPSACMMLNPCGCNEIFCTLTIAAITGCSAWAYASAFGLGKNIRAKIFDLSGLHAIDRDKKGC